MIQCKARNPIDPQGYPQELWKGVLNAFTSKSYACDWRSEGVQTRLHVRGSMRYGHRMSTSESRQDSLLDRLIMEADRALAHIFCEQPSSRAYAAEKAGPESTPLLRRERERSAALMRVNHAGEVSAQALYQGQALTARDPSLRRRLKQASMEESDHLNWCRRRLRELDAHTSRLDPLWYLGALAIGMAAGVAGDRWNLGFLAETEYQVVRHLESHLQRLPAKDRRSRAIVEQMREDELGHARLAEALGAAELPPAVKSLMRIASSVMTTISERI